MRAYGTGTVFYDKTKKKYVARIIIGTTANGTAKYKSKSGTNPKPLRAWLKAQQKAILLGEYESKEQTKETLVTISRKINADKLSLNLIKESTHARNEETIKIIEKSDISDICVSDLTADDITKFYASLTHYSKSIIEKVVRCVKQALHWAVEHDIIIKNPADYVLMPKSKKQTKKVSALTIEQQKQLIEDLKGADNNTYLTMILLSMFTGMRIGEIAALYYSDVNLFKHTITVSKTTTRDLHGNTTIGETPKTANGIRTIELNNSAYKVITDYIKDNKGKGKELLFKPQTNSRTGVVNTSSVNIYFKKFAPEGYSAHSLRHTFATRCIEGGMPVKVLSKMLGHADIKVTLNTYTDVFEKYEKDNIKKVDEYLNAQGIKYT